MKILWLCELIFTQTELPVGLLNLTDFKAQRPHGAHWHHEFDLKSSSVCTSVCVCGWETSRNKCMRACKKSAYVRAQIACTWMKKAWACVCVTAKCEIVMKNNRFVCICWFKTFFLTVSRTLKLTYFSRNFSTCGAYSVQSGDTSPRQPRKQLKRSGDRCILSHSMVFL